MELNKCLGCMEDFRGYPCPKCGYDPQRETGREYALPLQTILAGKYLIGRVLGQGGFGITYIGWDIALERKVAIKEYYPSGQVSRSPGTKVLTWYTSESAQAARQAGMEMFLKEARKMAKVEDIPGVVKVRELFRENETAYIVMDFVEGETLKARLKRTGPMPWAQAKAIFRPAIQAMEKVHQAGLIHRDLSPDDIMLLPDGSVKILDLGAAKDLNVNSGASSMQVAKGGFSPFEQYTQRGGFGPWTDVYAMAATIYFTLTGKLPPAAMDWIEEDTISWNLPGLDALPASALSALQKALAVTAKKRTQSMEELEKGLFEEVVEPEPKPQPKKVSKKIIWAAVAAVAVVLSGIVYGTVLKPASDYKKALAMMEAGQYEEAETAFEALGDYQDSAEKVVEAKTIPVYQQAQALLDAGKYEEAEAAFAALEDYLDSGEKAEEAKKAGAYQQAQALLDSGKYSEAEAAFTALGDYADSAEKAKEARNIPAYQQAQVLVDEGQFDEAISAFKALGEYKDSPEQVRLVTAYRQAAALEKFGQYPGAAIAFSKLGDYRDSAQRAETDKEIPQMVSLSVCDSVYGSRTVGLRSDGTVVAVGWNEYGQCDVSGWTDIVAVVARDGHTVGLRSDGTVVAAGYNGDGQCNVSGWSDIVAVAAGYSHTVGLRRDGTVVAVGSNGNGKCDVDDWKDILIP